MAFSSDTGHEKHTQKTHAVGGISGIFSFYSHETYEKQHAVGNISGNVSCAPQAPHDEG